MASDPSGRRALVTGANRGIGLEVVRQLSALGLRVFLGSRDPGRGAAAAASLGSTAGSVEVVAIDVADASSIAAAAAAIGTVDVVVSNAAIRPLGRVPAAVVDEAWRTNVLGPWRVARAFVPAMRRQGWGRVVNVSTEAASGSARGVGDLYAITKVAMNATTRTLADDLAGSGVLVNAISPGWCRTDMGGDGAPRSAADGAASIVWGVTLPDDGPTGGYFQDGRPLEW